MDISVNKKDNNFVSYEKPEQGKLHKAISLKTERLTSAVYLVTGLMDSSEKIKDELRSTALSSISDLYIPSKISSRLKNFVSDKIIEKIDHIISLLEVGLVGGLISKMNCSILKEEYSKLKDILLKFQILNGEDNYILPDHFLGEDIKVTSKLVRDTSKMSFINNNPKSLKNIDTYKTEDNKKNIASNYNKIKAKSSRQDLIIRTIKDDMEYTIKDIISAVSVVDPAVDCSDKTIQRDLTFLVVTGVLKKRGERRWSRYSKNIAS